MPTGVYKRKPCQEKTKDKLRVAMKKRIATLGHMNSPETRKKMRLSHKDKKPANWDSVKHLFLHSCRFENYL